MHEGTQLSNQPQYTSLIYHDSSQPSKEYKHNQSTLTRKPRNESHNHHVIRMVQLTSNAVSTSARLALDLRTPRKSSNASQVLASRLAFITPEYHFIKVVGLFAA